MEDRALPVATGVITAILGLLAMVGWWVGASVLVQVRPEYAPTQFHAAVGLVMCGAALALYGLRRTVTASLLGMVAAAGGLAALAQYIFGVDLGLDQVLLRVSGVTPDASHAAHMGANTALEFVLFGLALLVAPIIPLAANVFGALVLAVAAIPLFGYFAGVREALAWGGSSEMGLLTALAFLILGGGLAASARTQELGQRSWRFAPEAIGAIVAAGVVLFWRTLDDGQSAQVRRALTGARAAIEREIEVELRALGRALQVVAAGPPNPREVWPEEVRLLRRSFPGTIALEWIDANLQLRGDTLPEAAPEAIPPPDAREREACEFARSSEKPVLAPAIRLETGDPAARMVAPRFVGGRLEGFVSAVVRLREFVDALLEGDAPDYAIELAVGDVAIYRRGDVSSAEFSSWQIEGMLRPPGTSEWSLIIGPSPELVAAVRDPLPEIVLVVGALFALLLSATLRLVRTSAQRSEELADEVDRRRQAEGGLRDLAASLEERVNERTEQLRGANAALNVQNALRQSVQTSLARSNEDLKRFAAFVSHELRQPLATMDIWARLLESGSEANVDEKGRRQVVKIRSAINRMTRLIDGELALAQLMQQDPTMERVEVAALITDVVSEMRAELDAVGGRVEVAELPVLRADPAQLRRVFRNLIENSLKYRRPDLAPVIRIEGEMRPCSADGGASECVIRVHDNGRGFAPGEAEDIFAMFQRGRNEHGPGSGVGLAVCRRIVERHGGSIWGEGRPGEGATFVMVFSPDHCLPAEAAE